MYVYPKKKNSYRLNEKKLEVIISKKGKNVISLQKKGSVAAFKKRGYRPKKTWLYPIAAFTNTA